MHMSRKQRIDKKKRCGEKVDGKSIICTENEEGDSDTRPCKPLKHGRLQASSRSPRDTQEKRGEGERQKRRRGKQGRGRRTSGEKPDGKEAGASAGSNCGRGFWLAVWSTAFGAAVDKPGRDVTKAGQIGPSPVCTTRPRRASSPSRSPLPATTRVSSLSGPCLQSCCWLHRSFSARCNPPRRSPAAAAHRRMLERCG